MGEHYWCRVKSVRLFPKEKVSSKSANDHQGYLAFHDRKLQVLPFNDLGRSISMQYRDLKYDEESGFFGLAVKNEKTKASGKSTKTTYVFELLDNQGNTMEKGTL